MKNFKLSATIAAIFSTGLAFANPPATTYSASVADSGRISVQSSTYAAVSGTGDSLSHAATQAGSNSTGSVSASPTGISITGAVGGYVNAQAYNTKTGSGTGSASAGGWSDASMNGSASLNIPGTGSVSGMVGIDGGMGNAVQNGVDAHVVAGSAQDGYAGGTYAGTAQFNGTPSGVTSTQTADGESYAGAITFEGGPPAGQSAAVRTSNSGVQVSISGAFNNGSTVVTPPPAHHDDDH